MSYTYKKIGTTYVVWFAPANRFMQIQEPAFRILRDWSNHLPEEHIIWNCAKEYELPESEARSFVKDVIGQLQKLISNYSVEKIITSNEEVYPLPDEISFSAKYYLINGNTFLFRYGDMNLQTMFHPGLAFLETKKPESEAGHTFDLFCSGNELILQTDRKKSWTCSDSKTEFFIGLVYLQLLNGIYNTSDSYWMGAVHASAVSAGKGAVLFTAPSGSGKSTFAAMLLNKGYQVLSDDFSPISIRQPKVFPFPEGISVKNRSLHVLQPFFPALADQENALTEEVYEVFLPITNGKLPEAAPVKAIVFLRYKPYVDVEFYKISNLEAMDRFLQQMWLPPTNEIATQFMDWYFQIPCYILNYSNNRKAIDSVSKLFN